MLWDSGRQACVTLSKAESELVGYSSGHPASEALGALIETVNSDQPLQKLLYGDNKAALNRTLENKAFAHHSTCVERSSQETRAGMAGVWWARHSMPSD